MTEFAVTPKLQLLPAIDMVDGKAVRLTQGEAGTETNYGSPVDAAMDWIEQGAEWIHLVDLDAAFGRGSNVSVAKKIISRAGNVNIEFSGGIRDDASLEAALDMGARRVNLGTAALENPEWTRSVIARFGDQIAVGLDVRGEVLSTRGWTEDAGNIWEVLARLEDAGCPRYVVTDVTKDGTMRGPNLELLAKMCEHTDRPVVASGGVSSLEDLVALRGLVPNGVEGAIIGKALYDGAFTLPAALDIASR
ncbi:1-(5-phosphoribosyl)-5-[(5-phosphoribosylamino)methylideneamino] imidazole-4-carboxamide isomerase/N-(5'phosphoribosyl)anthranilate isomerase [Leucobacter exalbidus]|uniref:1-(5-phosphoribosyl)-5-[(5-phosphoribosylamino)methylideneamino] imidazole-4-carboxamide isomerase n=1 Tax=Leucobacter exalbidus TaxID=662960 RepID=A0A940PV54_9MICO|nr:bifunctional 1-(5-phosphoribosyl)-5-((5-phosphoribosylamino)methylideneamino)imidazole-4-carboxamide isomerase/phosphoribosylanthranilate isomerase PriA [Leucobacter exalbidus]MBP1327567.1 1-(5-phosphoribosyl)-5-[(5-phosphoribosylamino)methylideneamino] imidazole-4-carboxamide isomerase/N-(5'phosphoribosyl)anthranilate isomerase [Leucobacter exalbidus]